MTASYTDVMIIALIVLGFVTIALYAAILVKNGYLDALDEHEMAARARENEKLYAADLERARRLSAETELDTSRWVAVGTPIGDTKKSENEGGKGP